MEPIPSQDIPQADNLDTLRLIVEGVATNSSSTTSTLEDETGLAPRQLSYYLNAARALGLLAVNDGEWLATEKSASLLATTPGSAEESIAWRVSIDAMPLIVRHLGSLFTPAPSRADIAQAIASASGLGAETARRRAETLARWRARLTASQETLVFTDATPEAASTTTPLPATAPAPASALAPAAAPPPTIAPAPTAAPAPTSAPSAPTEGKALLSAPTASQFEPSSDQLPEVPPVVVAPQLDASVLGYLRDQIERAELILFTGAGFSVDARDLDGRSLPLGNALAKDVWSLLFPNDEYDDSGLPDLFGAAKLKKPAQLRDLIARRLRVDPSSVPDYMRVWFEVPWRRVYTLNVDDLEEAVAQRFFLPRVPVPISAVDHNAELVSVSVREMPVAHLNGSVTDNLEALTFSAQDYARRLAAQEPWYAQLAADLFAHPFIFVGSPLDEPLFWQHIAIRGMKGRDAREHRPRSFLVTPTLPRAKEALLEEHHIHWIRATSAEFAQLLSTMMPSIEAGHATLKASIARDSDKVENVGRVTSLLAEARNSPTLYLRGAEPTWSDLLFGRCALRVADQELAARSADLLKLASDSPCTLLLVSGTAGTGKSTGLMRLAKKLAGDGHDVAWVGPNAEVSTRTLGRFVRGSDAPDILFIDEAERYGAGHLPRLLREIRQSQVRLLVFAIREGRLGILENAALRDVAIDRYTMPPLQDSDIGALLDVLASQNRLGKLLGLKRPDQEQAFREQAGRQLLVAMMQATSDVPFEEKVHEEWRQLDPSQRYFYTLIAIASLHRYPMDRELLLLARGTRSPEDLTSIALLSERHIVVAERSDAGIRARHSLIAEKLIERLQGECDYLTNAVTDLAYAVAIRRGQRPTRAIRRFLKALINHDRLFRLLDADAAERIYVRVEELLKQDHHYWLQRGSLHNQHGDFALAEMFLDQAMSLDPTDPLVQTEHAHMRLKKACRNPRSPDAVRLAEDTIAELRRQNEVRGTYDTIPVHVLGVQGLAWSRRAAMSVEDRRAFLRGLKGDLDLACERFPRKQDIRDLRDHLHRELLELSVAR